MLLLLFLLAINVATASPTACVLALSESKTFTCTAVADDLAWLVNGSGANFFITSGISQDNTKHIGDGLLQRILTVHAREEHNNSQLQCFAFTGRQRMMVKEVKITIQGLLSSPGNVTTTNGSSSILLSWTAPFTLDITDVDPDISHYTVYITNLNTGRMGEENVTETEFIFTGLPGEGTPDPCHTYQFRVSAWNVVGEGDRSEPVYGHFIADLKEDSLKVGISYTVEEYNIVIICLFQVNSTCPAAFYLGYIQSTSSPSEKLQFTYLPTTVELEDGTLTFVITDYVADIPLNNHWDLQILAENDSRILLHTTFSTFDIQNVIVQRNNNSPNNVTVICHFLVGSQAQGCHVEFIPIGGNRTTHKHVTILRRQSESVASETVTLPTGGYTLLAYDIEMDGNTSAIPAVNQTEQIMITEEPAVTEYTVGEPSGTPTLGTSSTSPSSKTIQQDLIVIIASGVGGTCTLTIVMTVAVIAVFCCLRKKKNHSASSYDISLKVNQAYEIRRIGRRSIPVEPCAAYGIAGSRQ